MVFYDMRKHFRSTVLSQAIVSFCFGLLLAPYGSGIFVVAVMALIKEICTMMFTDNYYESAFARAGILCSSFSGWIIGRAISGLNPTTEGVPEVY
jgi:hypothetical protein